MGEKLTSRAGRSHVIAQEVKQMLHEIEKDPLPLLGKEEDIAQRSGLLGKRVSVYSRRRYRILQRLLRPTHIRWHVNKIAIQIVFLGYLDINY